MTQTQSVLLGSLVIGSLVGLGAYLGLRDGPEPAQPAQTASPTLPATSAGQSSSSPIANPAAKERVVANAREELERLRPELNKKCWTEQAAKQPQPARSKFVWNFTFGADGKMTGRGISEDRETLRRGTSICLSEALPMFSIPPPGQTVQVDVEFTLP